MKKFELKWKKNKKKNIKWIKVCWKKERPPKSIDLPLIPSKRIIGIEEEEEKINFNSHNLKRQSKISFNQPRISIPTDILNVSLPPTINIRIHLLLERCRGHACSQSGRAMRRMAPIMDEQRRTSEQTFRKRSKKHTPVPFIETSFRFKPFLIPQ